MQAFNKFSLILLVAGLLAHLIKGYKNTNQKKKNDNMSFFMLNYFSSRFTSFTIYCLSKQ